MALFWRPIANLKGAKGDVGTYYKRTITADDDIFTLPPGSYRVAGAGSTNARLPVARYGDLIVHSEGGPRTLTFQTNDLGATRFETRAFVIGSDNSGSFTGKTWRELTTSARGRPANHAIDVWAKEPGYNGSYAIDLPSVATAGSVGPTNYGYILEHETQPAGGTRQVAYATHVDDQGVYHRGETATASGELTPWKRIMDERMSPALNRGQLLFDEMAAANGGKVFTGNAVPVALTFDDFPRDFRDTVMPLLRARGLPCTIGLSSKMYEPTSTGIYAGATGTTWAEINAWPSTITIANHSATHSSATDRFGMYAEIVHSLRDLRLALPGKKIYTWMQPSVTYDPRFENGGSTEAYASTIAGHLQLGHHAFVTGSIRYGGLPTVPMMGNRIPHGIGRVWVDSSNGIASAPKTITDARAIKHGLILGAHADRFGKPGLATVAELTGLLNWLKAEQDAGRVKVLTLEQFAIAQYGSL
ncbi:polysaccharide deacetylase family protein [Arthrobacter citreus]|uniref:polysaccharide deacetylase family protein n=1 Tax=Arthrobacter TaxID=1663 RepID=UPI001264C2A4|nr:polysaccharide deacetylase family protein [Arthrobacter gandavensis]